MRLITEKIDVQNRIINYLRSIDWNYIPPQEIIELRGGIKEPFLIPIVIEKMKKLNKEVITDENVFDVIKKMKLVFANLNGNEEFLNYLRGKKTFYSEKEKRERNIKLIDYENLGNNNFLFTQEFEFEDKDLRRIDIILFINGFPIGIIENKAPTVKEAEEEAMNQINLYTDRIPELIKFSQFYATCNGINLHYGPTWKYESKTFYRWKTHNGYNFEKLTKTFFNREEILKTLEKYIVFLRIDEEIQKYILKQHQRRALRKILKRILYDDKSKGLVWHTQGAYKTVTMIVSADELRKFPELENPTIMVVVDRLELESQILQNFEAFGFPNIKKARSKRHLQELISSDYRGLIITTIHKFEGISKHINTRSNIVILIDEAHRSQEGDLGNYMRGALPNAYYIGFTGTPIDKGKIGRGTFVTFGYSDEPYLDKYAIDESIEDKTTVPLYYSLTPIDLHVDKETLEEEFFKVMEEEGIASIEGLNKIIEKAEKLKAVLKSSERVDKIAEHIAKHYKKFIEPLGFKAFIVAVDREGCALYKEAIDKYLPHEYTQVVYTRNHRDGDLLRKYHISKDEEKNIRKAFKSPNEMPKILIVTQKLLTGFDAPILYVMYLDKPFKDHTLLQAIARVNRPYKGKTSGMIVDYIGIFDNLQRALSFDSKDISKALLDIKVLKERFKDLMSEAEKIFNIVDFKDEDKRLTNIINYFFDEDNRNNFIKMFKNIQEIYEILSPDEFLRDYIRDYQSLVQIYEIIYNEFDPEAASKKIHRNILKKTEKLIEENVELRDIVDTLPIYEINKDIANLIRTDNLSDRVKISNLRRSLVIYIERNKRNQPYLISISEKIEEIIKQLEEKQTSVQLALDDLINLSEEICKTEDKQQKSGLGKEEYSIYWILKKHKVDKPEEMAIQINKELEENREWFYNRKIEQTLRKELYKLLFKFSIFKVSSEDTIYKPSNLKAIVDNVLNMHMHLLRGEE